MYGNYYQISLKVTFMVEVNLLFNYLKYAFFVCLFYTLNYNQNRIKLLIRIKIKLTDVLQVKKLLSTQHDLLISLALLKFTMLLFINHKWVNKIKDFEKVLKKTKQGFKLILKLSFPQLSGFRCSSFILS